MQAVQLHITHASRRLQYEAGSRLAAAWRAAAAAACTRIQLRAVNRWTDSAGRLGRCCCVSLHAMSHLGDQYNCLDARASHFAAGKLGPGGGLDRCCCASLRAMSAADVSSSLSDSVSVSSSSESVSSESLGCAPAAFGCASNNMEVALQKGGCPRHSASDSVSASLSVSSPWCPSAPAPVPTVAPSLGVVHGLPILLRPTSYTATAAFQSMPNQQLACPHDAVQHVYLRRRSSSRCGCLRCWLGVLRWRLLLG